MKVENCALYERDCHECTNRSTVRYRKRMKGENGALCGGKVYNRSRPTVVWWAR